MDPATLIMLAKIVSDLIIVVTMGIQKVEGLTAEEKQTMLTNLQVQTGKLVGDLQSMAAK